jgi:diguanylate cyclase (GGDEF)-like protein
LKGLQLEEMALAEWLDWIAIAKEWDYSLFVVLAGACLCMLIYSFRKPWLTIGDKRGIRAAVATISAITVVVLCVGWFLVQYAEKREYERVKGILTSNAPILAYELSQQGHGGIGLNTLKDDTVYVKLMEDMVQWMRLNDQILSVYTMRKLDNGSNVFILAPETDYNRNGIIDGELETSDPIGLVYDEEIPELEEAFKGRLTFESKVTEDQWGKAISAFVPIYYADGRQEAVLGIDFNGEAFFSQIQRARLDMIGLVAFILAMFNGISYAGFYYFGKRQDVRHRKELQYIAYHDALTGLPNRVYLLEQLGYTLGALKGKPYTAAVFFIDIDRFKNVNDSLGHAIGDKLLQQLAGRLADTLEAHDLLARPGGDELIVLMRQVHSREDLVRKAEKLHAVLDRPIAVDSYELYVTASIGASMYPAGGGDADMMMRNADSAMYYAKERGIRFHIYTDDLNARLLRRLELETGLRKALGRGGEFMLYYQPKIDIHSGRAVGAEALIRWNHPDKGLVSPNEFISAAEDSGLIVPLGDWVLGEACRQLKEWESRGLPSVLISVNLSARQFQTKDLAARLQAILKEHAVHPNGLELELTESCVMQTPDLSGHTLRLLKKVGFGIALDDFGTGYSSLGYLRSFPLDVIKIDKGFVKDMVNNADNAVIVTAIIKLAHSLGMKVICEGVETKEQLDFLKEQGCDEIQGYYFSPPIPPDEFARKFLDDVNFKMDVSRMA